MDEQTNPCVIFIVEDDDDERLLLSYEFQDNGLEKGVHFFSDLNDLIDFSYSREQNFPPSLILLNPYMPKFDVHHAVTLLKSMEELRTVPLVVMLGSQSEKELLRSYNLNVSGYIKKPVNAQILKRFLKIR